MALSCKPITGAQAGRHQFVIDARVAPARWPVKSEVRSCGSGSSKGSGQDWRVTYNMVCGRQTAWGTKCFLFCRLDGDTIRRAYLIRITTRHWWKEDDRSSRIQTASNMTAVLSRLADARKSPGSGSSGMSVQVYGGYIGPGS